MPDTESAINTALDAILRHEGGWADDPDDPGGATNRGITLATLQQLRPGATIDDLRQLSVDDARQLYRQNYIHAPHFDELPGCIIPNICDHAVNAGIRRAAILLQQVLCDAGHPIAVDAQIGPGTIAAAQGAVSEQGPELNNVISDARCAYYRHIAEASARLAKFLRGWLLRADSFRVTRPIVGAAR